VIFTAEEIRAMLSGAKTQTRRPRRDFDPYVRRQGGQSAVIRPFRPVRGDTFPAQRRKAPDELDRREQDQRWLARVEGRRVKGRRVARRFVWPTVTVGRLVVVDVRQQLAGDITYEDARAEGYPTVDDWKAMWLAFHDLAWVAANVDADAMKLAGLAARFAERHAFRPVWAITFELDRVEPVRYLAARSQEGYVHSAARALPDEPAALSAVEHRTHVAGNAAMTHEQWKVLEHTNRELELALLSFDERLWRVRRAAAARHMNVSSDLRVIERLIVDQKRRQGWSSAQFEDALRSHDAGRSNVTVENAASSIVGRLAALEGKVYRASTAA
jgi:hypothetical protein